MKWANEADFVMPVLTPKFMHEIHHGSAMEGEDGGLLPVAPQLNRFLYTLMRARYGHVTNIISIKNYVNNNLCRFSDEGCRNTMIRPIIPTKYHAQMSKLDAVNRDPLFRLIWITDKEQQLMERAKFMLEGFAKKMRA